MLTFQKLISQLSSFWEKKGCVLHLGHDLETGAGTFNPATFLRCLGPEPYDTAYVEPSRRPQDGRYGENPNRVQLFHQYQVILKPSPPEVQQWYLESLSAIGLDRKKHDIRFVHSDWESPSLGAWGLGWEVWCDGMEVSQFTYFQAIASLPLHPISAEITYGLERLAMYVQNVHSIFDVHWNEKLTFGDIAHESEIEWSAYNFTEATTQMWLNHFQDYEREAKNLIARHLPIPAYDFVIKASHAFNILDARGVISATERTGYIARIRDLARLVGVEYIASREKLEFPLLKKEKEKKKKHIPFKAPKTFNPKKREDFLLEVGSEELPDSFIPVGAKSLESLMRAFFQEHELSFQDLKVFGTPRRLAILVKGLAHGTENKRVEKRGPPLTLCFDGAGKLTQQGQGFLKACGLSSCTLSDIRAKKVRGLDIRSLKDQEYLFAELTVTGKSTVQLLQEHLAELILKIDFPKKMRWGSSEISYARPLRWVTCLFGKTHIPFYVGDIASGKYSFGHAQLKPHKLLIKSADSYISTLKKGCVLADFEERKKSIVRQLDAIEKKTKSTALEKERVLSEVLNLVEWPKLTYATFSLGFLRAPQEVLISEMVHHQKYFPLADKKGELKNLFVITADKTPSDLIRKGNQKVLSARLSDGVFLYEQDLKTPLETWNEKLKLLTFQKDLGSMFEKVMRLTHHVTVISQALALGDDRKIARAALLSKADLVSQLVGEFPELQGIAGRYYALAQNENPEVAEALSEQWMPRQEKAPLPKTPTGTVLSLADKVDNLLGYFSVGLKPTSSSDPFALRRQTFGLIKILLENPPGSPLDLREILKRCATQFPRANPEVVNEILHFITARAKTVFEDEDFRKDEIEAAMQGYCVDPFDLLCKLRALSAFRKKPEFAKLFEVYKRAKGQLEQAKNYELNPSLLKEPAEKNLHQHLESMQKKYKDALKQKMYVAAFEHIASLQPFLAKLFDTVKILADDEKIRNNRMALLHRVFSLFEQLLDFSKIQEMK